MEEAHRYASEGSDGAQAFPRQGGSSEHRSSSHGHHTSRHELRKTIDALRKQRLALFLATAGALTASVVVGFTARQLWSELSDVKTTLAEEREAFQTSLGEAETNLAKTRKALKTAHSSMGALVEKRIPGLRKMELDRAVPIEKSAVRDITFTQLRGSEKGSYEVKAVMENTSPIAVSPTVRIVLFDEVGVQVGRLRIGPEVDGKNLTLRPGEILSHFDAIEVDPGRQAHYFRLEVTSD